MSPTQQGPSSERPLHPSTAKLVVLRNHIDVEEESRLYDELCDVRFLPASCADKLTVFNVPRLKTTVL
jgi:hypothetical protein